MQIYLRLGCRGFQRPREGHRADYPVLTNKASSLGWLGLLRGLTSSPLLSEESDWWWYGGGGGKSNLLHPHFTEPRGKMRLYSQTLADTGSTASRSSLGGCKVKPKANGLIRNRGNQPHPFHASVTGTQQGYEICHLSHVYSSNPWAPRQPIRGACRLTPTPPGTVTPTKLLLSRKGQGAHTTQGAQRRWTAKKIREKAFDEARYSSSGNTY